LNRLTGEIPEALQERIDSLDIPLLGVVPADGQLTEFEFSGVPLVELNEDSPVYQSVSKMMAQILA
jgi:CO dehydrogenase nickel-insertion accessory protein CooC1